MGLLLDLSLLIFIHILDLLNNNDATKSILHETLHPSIPPPSILNVCSPPPSSPPLRLLNKPLQRLPKKFRNSLLLFHMLPHIPNNLLLRRHRFLNRVHSLLIEIRIRVRETQGEVLEGLVELFVGLGLDCGVSCKVKRLSG